MMYRLCDDVSISQFGRVVLGDDALASHYRRLAAWKLVSWLSYVEAGISGFSVTRAGIVRIKRLSWSKRHKVNALRANNDAYYTSHISITT